MTWQVEPDWQPPDHPWDEARSVAGYCEICGSPQIVHDGNLDKVFDWMRLAP